MFVLFQSSARFYRPGYSGKRIVNTDRNNSFNLNWTEVSGSREVIFWAKDRTFRLWGLMSDLISILKMLIFVKEPGGEVCDYEFIRWNLFIITFRLSHAAIQYDFCNTCSAQRAIFAESRRLFFRTKDLKETGLTGNSRTILSLRLNYQ